MFVLEHVYGTCLWNIFHEHFLPMSPPPSVSLKLQNDAKRCKLQQQMWYRKRTQTEEKIKFKQKWSVVILFPHKIFVLEQHVYGTCLWNIFHEHISFTYFSHDLIQSLIVPYFTQRIRQNLQFTPINRPSPVGVVQLKNSFNFFS